MTTSNLGRAGSLLNRRCICCVSSRLFINTDILQFARLIDVCAVKTNPKPFSGQLSLAIPLWIGAMTAIHWAVMLCGWGVKAAMVGVWVAGKTV